MGYFSYRPTDLGGAYGYTVRNVALIRRGTGNPQVAIHAIGGVGDDVSAAQVDAFVRATRVCGVAGASLYDFTTTVPGGWKYLRAVRPGRQRRRHAACSDRGRRLGRAARPRRHRLGSAVASKKSSTSRLNSSGFSMFERARCR